MRADIKAALEAHYKARYEEVIAEAGAPAPAWEDLTEIQRSTIRAEVRRYEREMTKYGNKLRKLGLMQ